MAKELSENISSNYSSNANVSSSSVQSMQTVLQENLSSNTQTGQRNISENESSVSAQFVQANMPGNISNRHRYLANRQARIQKHFRRISSLSPHYKPSRMQRFRMYNLGKISEENIKLDEASSLSERSNTNETSKISERTIKFDKASRLSVKTNLEKTFKLTEKTVKFENASRLTETTIKFDKLAKLSDKASSVCNKKYIELKNGQVAVLMSKGYVYFTPEKGQRSKIKSSPTKVVSCHTESSIISPSITTASTSHHTFSSEEFHKRSKSFSNDGFSRPVNRVPPVQRLPFSEISRASKKRFIVGSRYTIQEKSLEIWRSKLFDKEFLSFVQNQWLSDCWDGLYDPPEWLRPGMFAIALDGIQSNKLKRKKYERAEANLKIARLTHSCRVKEKMENLCNDIIFQYSNHFNLVGINLIKLMTKITSAIERLKTEIEKTGNNLVDNANKFNVEIRADMGKNL